LRELLGCCCRQHKALGLMEIEQGHLASEIELMCLGRLEVQPNRYQLRPKQRLTQGLRNGFCGYYCLLQKFCIVHKAVEGFAQHLQTTKATDTSEAE
jgi:hypothetical protein